MEICKPNDIIFCSTGASLKCYTCSSYLDTNCTSSPSKNEECTIDSITRLNKFSNFPLSKINNGNVKAEEEIKFTCAKIVAHVKDCKLKSM